MLPGRVTIYDWTAGAVLFHTDRACVSWAMWMRIDHVISQPTFRRPYIVCSGVPTTSYGSSALDSTVAFHLEYKVVASVFAGFGIEAKVR